MISSRTVQVDAPAKINLGLELLGKRPDGYHEIRTVMAMVGLTDRLVVEPVTNAVSSVSGLDLEGAENLVAVARDAYAAAVGSPSSVRIDVTKHIPIAAGLGGASADAACTFLALDALQNENDRLGPQRLLELSAGIGSDVPFFLGSPVALASGTGTTLAPLPALLGGWHAVLASPAISLPRKTATLYSLIRPSDFTDGSRADMLGSAIASGDSLAFGAPLLANPFRAAWSRLGDPIAPIEVALRQAGAEWVALSGAGPTVYTLTDDGERAEAIAERTRDRVKGPVIVHVAPLLSHGVRVVDLNGVCP